MYGIKQRLTKPIYYIPVLHIYFSRYLDVRYQPTHDPVGRRPAQPEVAIMPAFRPKKSSESKSQASAKSTNVKDREAGATNPKPPSSNQPGDVSHSRPPNVVVSTSKLAASASSAQASGGGSSSTSRLTRRQTSVLGAHLWFVERMTSVSRKKQVVKLAAETKLTEAQARHFHFFPLVNS